MKCSLIRARHLLVHLLAENGHLNLIIQFRFVQSLEFDQALLVYLFPKCVRVAFELQEFCYTLGHPDGLCFAESGPVGFDIMVVQQIDQEFREHVNIGVVQISDVTELFTAGDHTDEMFSQIRWGSDTSRYSVHENPCLCFRDYLHFAVNIQFTRGARPFADNIHLKFI